jgi:hypothetical protein
MLRSVEVLLVLAVLGGGIWFLVSRQKNAATNDAAQAWVEDRMLHLLRMDPNASDQVIATLVRDEIVNTRRRHPAFFAWAVPETVARLKRTALRIVVEQSVAELAAPGVGTTMRKPQRKCAACGTKNKASRERCRKCFERLSDKARR